MLSLAGLQTPCLTPTPWSSPHLPPRSLLSCGLKYCTHCLTQLPAQPSASRSDRHLGPVNPNRQVSPNLPPTPHPLDVGTLPSHPTSIIMVTFHVNWGPDTSGHLPATLHLPLNLSPTWTLLKCAFAQSLKIPLCPSSGSKKKKMLA